MGHDAHLRWTAAQARAAFAAAPVSRLEALLPGDGALVIVAPHPDDESLGCGGLIARAADAGRDVMIAVLTDGAGSHPSSPTWPPARLAALRRAELDAAVAGLTAGRGRVDAFDAPDGRLAEQETAAQAWLAGVLADRRVAAVFATWEADPHPDHKAAFRIAARQAAAWGAALYAYPVWGLTLDDPDDAGPARPCLRLDVSAVLDRKRAAIAAHRSQVTTLIDDDPAGFRLRDADLARHLDGWEVFLRVAGAGVR